MPKNEKYEHLWAAYDSMSHGVSTDMDWFGVDRNGQVAGFSCSLFGLPIPSTVFDSFELYRLAYEAIDALPQCGDAVWVGEKPTGQTYTGYYEYLDDWASRGLFAYYMNQNSRPFFDTKIPYGLYCYPTTPILVSQLPAEVAEYISRTKFEEFCFRDSTTIAVE